jgi:UDP-N-acetylglucosamine acyltransferase
VTQVHATAVVAAGAQLGADVEIGPYCIIGPQVSIGDGTRLFSHVVIDGRSRLGARCRVFPFASLGTQTQDLKYDGGETFIEIGNDTTIREYVTVNSGTKDGEVTRVGDRCLLMAYAHVAHACRIGDDVIMANAATLAGEVLVEDGATLGGMAGVHQFVRIGKLAFVGGCTKLTRDCMPFMLIDGNPAAVHGINRVKLQRLAVPENVQRDLKQAYRLLCRQDLTTTQALERIEAELDPGEEIGHLVAFVRDSERGVHR